MGEVTVWMGGGAGGGLNPPFFKIFNEMARFGCIKFSETMLKPPIFFKIPPQFLKANFAYVRAA